MSKTGRPQIAKPSLMLALLLCAPLPVFAQVVQKNRSHPEEIEWTWEVRPSHADAKLPNVALVGDSISRNYFPEVQRLLNGAANVYLFASSTSVGDPRLVSQLAEFVTMQGVTFEVIHFNNGMHGWAYSEAEFDTAFPNYLAAIRAMSPDAALVWATITPVKTDAEPGPTNKRVDSRNEIALRHIRVAGIPVDDQHALMMRHLDTFHDSVHFDDAGSNLEGQQAAESIRDLLKPLSGAVAAEQKRK